MKDLQQQQKIQERSFNIYAPKSNIAETISSRLDNISIELNVTNHTFLNKFASHGMSKGHLKRFAIQWYKVITAHKRAFGGLIYNTPNELLRADLITILHDEYGLGNPKNMHTLLFLRVPLELGLTKKEIDNSQEIEEVKNFREQVDKIWVKGSPAEAYGIVYLFEKIGAEFHRKFLQGLQKSGLSEYALQYSKLHLIAEEEHAKIVVNGLGLYEDQIEDLERGVRVAGEIMLKLWNGFEKYV